MKPIGGYFSLELANRGGFPHDDGILLNTARNSLEFILRTLGSVKMLHIPYYTCEVVMEPIKKLGIPYTCYRIDENLEIAKKVYLLNDEYLLYTNYFGIKDRYCQQLAEEYGDRLIIDNAQALFARSLNCAGTVYSVRKFVGVPDGGIAYTNNLEQPETLLNNLEQDQSYDRCSHLLKRLDLGASEGYADFHKNDESLIGQPIKRMSELTRTMLQSIDFEKVKAQRWQNFKQLHEALGSSNLLDIEKLSKSTSESMSKSFSCPMVYPYLTDKADLKKYLISKKVFVATYWPNVFDWCNPEDLEYKLADRCLAIPIDQRYGEDDVNFIIETINDMNNIKGKKLLLLGGTKISCEIVRQAHKMGVYVVVTDYNKPEDSPAKQIADEDFMVSATDVDAVVDLIQRENIDGVICGFADVLLPYYADICKKAGLPCYANRELFELFIDKNKYKDACNKYGVPTIPQYDIACMTDAEKRKEIKYPVIFKPTDSSGARGITICYDESQLMEAYDKATKFSSTKEAILEQYLEGKEATVFWFFENGNAHLSMIGNRHMQNTREGIIPLPVGYTFPSTLTDKYIKDVVPAAKRMFKDLGVREGMMFMQCKVTDEGECLVYDIGYRLTGSLEYKILEQTCGYNPLGLLIEYAVSGKVDESIQTKIDPYLFGNVGWNISFLMNAGTIASIEGREDVMKLEGVVDAVIAHEVGESILESEVGLLKQICCRVLGSSKDFNTAKDTINQITTMFKVKDKEGNNILLPPLDLSKEAEYISTPFAIMGGGKSLIINAFAVGRHNLFAA